MRRALEIPAEVHLSPGDAIVVKREDLGIPPSAAVASCHLVGHDHFVSSLEQPNKLELLTLAGAGPAPREISRAVQSDVDGAGEAERVGQEPVDERAVAGRKGEVELSHAIDPVTHRLRHLPELTTSH